MSINVLFFVMCSDYLFKVLMIGNSGVGKSCLLLRFAVSSLLLGTTRFKRIASSMYIDLTLSRVCLG